MAEPTLQEIFGASALQDLDSITIAKSDLVGLIADAENTGESIVAALVLKIKSSLSQTNFDNNLDQSIYVENGFPNFVFRGDNNEQYRVDQLTVNFAKLDENETVNPNDY